LFEALLSAQSLLILMIIIAKNLLISKTSNNHQILIQRKGNQGVLTSYFGIPNSVILKVFSKVSSLGLKTFLSFHFL